MKKFAFGVVFFFYFIISFNIPYLSAQNISGHWEGALTYSGSKIRLAFNIEEQNGDLKATLDSPDQGARGIPIEKVRFQDDSLYLVLPQLGASYEGRLTQNGKTLEGQWKQGGISLPLTMERSEGGITIRRPQLPTEPVPYYSEEVVFENKKAGVKLSGTFTRPQQDGQHPAVILVTGSGPQDRDETILDHKPFFVLADYLSRHGIAVLRYDDRGFGQSTGNFTAATTEDFAQDAIAAFDYLQKRPDVRATHIGMLGHSEGGLIAPLVAQKKPLAFLVLLAAPVLPGNQLLLLQGEAILKQQGATVAELKNYRNLQNQILEVVRSVPDHQEAVSLLQELLQSQYSSATKEEEKENSAPPSHLSGQIAQLVSPWFRYYIAYNPAPSFASVNVPVLAVYGSKDVQVPATPNVEALQKIINEKGKNNYQIEILEGLNHLFQPASTGLPIEYNQIETTIAPKALELITSWIEQQIPSTME